jgi:hypothetical protein
VWVLIKNGVSRVKEEVSIRTESRRSSVWYMEVHALVVVCCVGRRGVFVNVYFMLIVVLSVDVSL